MSSAVFVSFQYGSALVLCRSFQETSLFTLTVIGVGARACAAAHQGQQHFVAWSSAEAELNAFTKAAHEGQSLNNLMTKLSDELGLMLKGDSIANDGILKRSGAGKVKPLSVRQLWLREKVCEGDLCHIKIPRLENVADAMTHYTTLAEAAMHFQGMNCFRISPQAEIG